MRAVAAAYAKINLSLDVGPLRPDGYHSLVSVMQTIGLADTIEVQTSDAGNITLTCDASGLPRAHADIPMDERNTAFRAAASVLSRSGVSTGIHIHITKRIPAQAGLGGGSSDAAAVLRAVAALVGWKPDHDEMTAMATAIGSDVPFFLTGGTALVRGRGEVVMPMPPAPSMHIVIAQPACGVSTRTAYAALDADARYREDATARVCDAIERGDATALYASLGNHFETVAPALAPPVHDLMEDMLGAGASVVRLCGSGSAVFGLADSPAQATAIAASLSQRHPFAVATHTVDSATALQVSVEQHA